MSLRPHAAFGRQREERIKPRPEWAEGDVLHLKARWAKSGKERRDVPSIAGRVR